MVTRIALPSSTSRIHSSLLGIIRDAIDRPDLTFNMRNLHLPISDDYELILCRGTDVPTVIGNGAADIGITGYDMAVEWSLEHNLDLEIRSLPSRTSFVTFATVSGRTVERIYTEYWNLTKAWQATSSRWADAELVRLHGSSEGVIRTDERSGGVLLVTSGVTAEVNGLDVTMPLMATDAVVVRPKGSDHRIGKIDPAALPALGMPTFVPSR
ncbi:ATP phosphoribosyltransferase [Actinoallomurus acanthiterrae]